MVVVTESIPYEELIKKLKKEDKIALITCNTCVRAYGTGGVEVMDKLEDRLKGDGYEITDRIVLATACFEDYIQAAPIGDEWTVAVLLSCDSGYGVVSHHLKGKKIIKGLKTVGIQQGRKPAPLAALEDD